MPLYEFRCRCCGERFERLVRASGALDDVICPRCQASEVERLFSAFARVGGGAGASAAACDPLPSGGG